MLLRRAKVSVRVEVDEARLRPMELPRLAGDNTRLSSLGWTPRVPIETTLDDVLGYWRRVSA
jgi:GDP-D-mannose dehydratase